MSFKPNINIPWIGDETDRSGDSNSDSNDSGSDAGSGAGSGSGPGTGLPSNTTEELWSGEIEQPKSGRIGARVGRLPVVNGLPVIGASDSPDRNQDLVPYTKALANESALVTDDGSLVGAIRIEPANITTAGDQEWRRRIDRLASIIASSVHGKVQFYSPVRQVDYSDRRDHYAEAYRAARRQARTIRQELPRGQTFEDAGLPMYDVIADVLKERAAVVHRYQQTTTVREHYVLVKVSPKESVLDVQMGGGFSSVWGIRGLVTKRRLREQTEDEQVENILGTLTDRMETLAGDIQTIPDVRAWPISAEEFAQVAADHYRAADMYAYSEFEDLIRGAPRKRPAAGARGGDGDPNQATHIAEQAGPDSLFGSNGVDVDVDGFDGGVSVGSGVDITEDGDLTETETETEAEAEAEAETEAPADGAASGAGASADETPEYDHAGDPTQAITADRPRSAEELSEILKDVLSPRWFDEPSMTTLELGEGENRRYSQTLVVENWPDAPEPRFLEDVLAYSPPGSEVRVSTPIESADVESAKRDLSDRKAAVKRKIERYKNKKWGIGDLEIETPRHLVRGWEHNLVEITDMLDALEDADYGMATMNTYIECRAVSQEKLREVVSRVRSKMQDMQASTKPLKCNQPKGWQSVAPAVDDQASAPVQMLGEGIASLFSWSSRNLIEPGGISMGLHAERGEPLVYHPWERSSGFSMGVFGKVGNGKTTTMTRILLRMQLGMDWETLLFPDRRDRDDGLLTVLIDPLEEGVNMAQLFGGDRIVVGGDTNINPFHWEDVDDEKLEEVGEGTPRTQAERRAMGFMASYYNEQDLTLGDRKRGTLQKAVSAAFDRAGSGMESPTPGDVVDIMQEIVNHPERFVDEDVRDDPDTVAERKETAINILNNDLEPLKPGGIYEHFTHPTEVDLSGSGFVYFDLSQFENEKEETVGLYMSVLLSQVYEAAKVRRGPTVLANDECHYLLKNPEIVDLLKQMMLHHRHIQMMILFSTQALGEFFQGDGEALSSAGEIIFDNMVTNIFHFTDELDEEWAKELELSTDERAFIERADVGEALLQVGDEGTFPLKVDMGNNINPREFAVTEFDPSQPEVPEKLRDFIRGWTDDSGRDVCEWSWKGEWTGTGTGTGTGSEAGAGTEPHPEAGQETVTDGGEGDGPGPSTGGGEGE